MQPAEVRAVQDAARHWMGHVSDSRTELGGLKPTPALMDALQPEPILQFFSFAHLVDRDPELAKVSEHFAKLARVIVDTLPRNAERSVALRKLLESKDAAVRARLSK